MIQRGNLAEVQAWVESGKPLRMRTAHNSSNTRSMLEYAIEIGFYSMVELLLQISEWTDDERGKALWQAAYIERVDLIDLLLNYRAPWHFAEADDIFGTMNDDLIQRFLDLGLRFDDGDGFSTALSTKHARPLLRIYRKYRKQYPELDDQIAKALVRAVEKKQVRWTILLLWAGADPAQPVPHSLSGSIEDSSYTTTAIETALKLEDLSFLEQTKIEDKVGDLTPFLSDLYMVYQPDFLSRILEKIDTTALNLRDGGSRTLLERIVHHEFYNFGWYRNKEKEQADQLGCIRILLDHGAKWNPSENYYRSIRKGLCSYDARYIVQVIRLLLYTPGAAPFEKLWSLCNTAKMKHLIYSADDDLWREMNELAVEQGLKGSTKRSARRASR